MTRIELSVFQLRFLIVFFLFPLSLASVKAAPSDREPICWYTVKPHAEGQFVSVHAEIKLQDSPLFLKDFGQIRSIRWFVQDEEITVKSERAKDVLIFNQLPKEGMAQVIYELKCVVTPSPGYRKRLMGGVNFISVREGLYLGIKGYEGRLVDVRWDLPSGWQLALGEEGMQRFADTQTKLWIAGRMKQISEAKINESTLKAAVLHGEYDNAPERTIEAIKSIFFWAWKAYGPLEAKSYGIAIFPRGILGGGTQLGSTLATEEDWITTSHEMLHWWSNRSAPPWFREGVHTYIAAKILADSGLITPQQFMLFIKSCLKEHEDVVKREGKLSTLSESSLDYDRGLGGGDMYGLMPVFAYKLDREIQTASPGDSLHQVFAIVSRRRHRKIDILSLIKEKTGYDPEMLFQKYFDHKVENPEHLLR